MLNIEKNRHKHIATHSHNKRMRMRMQMQMHNCIRQNTRKPKNEGKRMRLFNNNQMNGLFK